MCLSAVVQRMSVLLGLAMNSNASALAQRQREARAFAVSGYLQGWLAIVAFCSEVLAWPSHGGC